MFDEKKHVRTNRLLAKVLIAGSVFLWPLQSVFADANLVTSSSYVSADAFRANTYMDAGGTWNGAAEVTNTTGDTFSFTVQNTAAGLVVDDSAFDLAISIDVASGFRLPVSPFAVTVTETPLCPIMAGITATQVGVGDTVTINIPADTDIEPGCSYIFDLGLTTNDALPSPADGTYAVDFDITYNVDDDLVATEFAQTQTENIEVRTGEIALLKTAVTVIAGDGDLVEFTVSLLGAGDGGTFDVELTDVLSSDLTGLVIIPPGGGPPGAAGPGLNQYTFEYIQEGEIVDVTVQATVSVDAAAVSCPILLNTASAVERTGTTSNFFDAVPFDLQNPFIDYTPPNITVPFGAAGIDVTIPVTNTGTGAAKNISISAANLAAYTILVDAATPNWSYTAGTGVFTFTGTIAAGVSENVTFNVSAATCPPPANENLAWIPAYQNACGTDFLPPLRFSSIAMSNTPDVSIAKVSSSGAFNIGEPGTYTLSLAGTNVINLPDDGVATNLDFVVTDTLPLGVTGAVINVIPATTEIHINGAALAYVAGDPIPDGADIEWRGDRADLTPLPSVIVDYTAGSALICPVGQIITNTAAIDYAACGINNTDGASFILNESPIAGSLSNFTVGGDGSFEPGAPDTNNISRDEAREGEQIPFTVSYSFPVGFAGTWSGTSFEAELRSLVGTGVPLVLTNNRNDVTLIVSRISDGALICNADIPVADLTGGDGTASLVIPDFGSIATCALPVNLADHNMVLTYSAISPEGDLAVIGDPFSDPINDDNVGNYLENVTLTVAGGPLSCLGTTEFVQAANVNIERADLGLTASINSGNPVSVCSVVPVSLNVAGPIADTSADNILLQFNDANFEFVDAAGNPGDVNTDINYDVTMAALAMTGSRAGSDIFMNPASVTSTVTADGVVDFNVRLRDSAVPQILSAQLDFDSKHTSPDGSAADIDNDYSVAINAAPFEVLSGQLEMEFFPPDVILLDSTTYSFRMQIANVGTGAAVNAEYRITLPVGMRFDDASILPVTAGPYDFTGQTIEWDLGDMAAAEVINIDIEVSIDQTTCFDGVGEEITSENEWGCGSPIINTEIDPPLIVAPSQLTLTHDAQNSFCELCGEGEIRLTVSNTGGVLLTDVNVTENLRISGLTYVANSTTYSVDGGAFAAAAVDPVPAGVSAETITWTSTHIPELANLYSAFSTGAGTPQEIEIVFRVERNNALFDDEGLISVDRNIEATADYGLFCGPPPKTSSSGLFELPIEQPVTDVIKLARNVSAGQPDTAYAETVYGGTGDDVIWRVNVTNNGADSEADLLDLLVNDTIGGNFDISQICNTEGNATLAAGGAAADGVNCIANAGLSATHDIAAPFLDALEGGETFIYFVGTIQATCTNHTNTTDIEYGCPDDSPPQGGIAAPGTNGGVQPIFDIDDDAFLSTAVDPAGVFISQAVTGSNSTQPLASKGILTVTINNLSGGTVRNIAIDDLLPTGYALDKTLINATVSPAFVAYPGMIDTITLTNDQPNDEDNTNPIFSLTSTSVALGPVPPAPQDHVLRHGDTLTITLGLIRVTDFDLVADPVVRIENTGDSSDPTYITSQNNALTITFEDTCSTALLPIPAVNNLSVTINPEDLDIDIDTVPTSSDLIFIISDPVPLDLVVSLTNNGGHDATDYFALVAVGDGLMLSSGVPGGCAAVALPREVWPPGIPASSVLYQCSTRDPLGPGETDTFTFSVLANVGGTDLTFRADVVGEITQADGTPLTFPTPDTGVVNNVANNYSMDSIRARLIGFGLAKALEGACSEGNLAADQVQIGEDCTYRLQASWFGFATPGFDSIKVQSIVLSEIVPNGQGFISQDTSASTGGVTTIVSTPLAPVALTETNIDWTFDPITSDETFSVAVVTRTLNDLLNVSAAPNVQGNSRSDVLDATFDVSFEISPGVFVVNTFDSTTPGFPRLTDRTETIRVLEPNLVVTKEVCNETNSITGIGDLCTPFSTLLSDGDTNDDYVYRIRILNEATGSGGFPRAPAFNVEVIDTLDATGLLTVAGTFDTDGLNNDGDVGLTDEGGEAVVVGSPQVITISHTTSTALERIDPGIEVDLFYRVDVSDAASPGQMLDNSAVTSYDTLAGVSGNQSIPQELTGTIGGARTYLDTAKTATIEITSLTAPIDSKGAMILSHTALGGATPFIGPQNVVIGEEIEFQLQVDMPVANLDSFIIRDVLPDGLRCIELQDINLSAGIYASAVFVPGGPPVSTTCTSTGTGDVVEWDFGSQQLTSGPTFNFTATFIARVDNSTNTAAGIDLINGGGAGVGGTDATLSYIDAGGTPVSILLGPATLRVVEPLITLDKAFTAAVTVDGADAQDELTVTVTATNTGAAPAYNLRVLDDLDAIGIDNLTYVAGSNSAAVTEDIVTLGANRPIFTLNPVAAIAPGDSVVFTYDIRVGDPVQPLELLDSTLQADWTSLQDNTTAINTVTGAIGADGTPLGMRIGAIPNAADTLNDFEVSILNEDVIVPAINNTKTDLTPLVVPTIGARKNFVVEFVIPEGDTNNLVLTDNLDFGGVSFELDRTAGYDVTYTFLNIQTINGAAPAEAVFNSFPLNGDSGPIQWNIGNIVTDKENDTAVTDVNPIIRINYFARINNDLATNAGDGMQNQAVLNYDNELPAGVISSAPAITVLEPSLTATKIFTNVTAGKAAGDLPDGGDEIEYVITILNSGGSTAFDVNIVDTLPAELQIDAGFLVSAEIAGTPVALFNPVPTVTALPTTLTWGQGNADGSLDIPAGLPAGQGLVLTYRVTLQDNVEPNLTINNSVLVDWTSLDGISVVERTGTSCIAITLPNDYCIGPVVAPLTVIDANAVTKVITADTFVAPVGTVRVGDVVTFQLQVDIQEGLTRNVELQDAMPIGYTFVDVVSVNGDPSSGYDPPVGSNFSYATIAAASLPTAGEVGLTTFTLGTITNTPDASLINDTFIIEYRARVTEDVGIPHVVSTTLDNIATLDYIDAAGAAPAADPRLTSTATTTVLQPLIDSLTKVDRRGVPFVSGVTIDPSTDVMQFRLEACNAIGGAPAYSLSLTDTLPVQIDETSITVPVVTIGGAAAADGIDYVYTAASARGGDMAFVFTTPLDPNECIVVDFDAAFYNDFGVGMVWDNTVNVDEYWSLPLASAQQYTPVGPALFEMNNIAGIEAPVKVLASPLTAEATIGDEIVYRITVPGAPMSGALHNVIVTDVLDPSLVFVSATDVSGNAFVINDITAVPGTVLLQTDLIPTGQQAIIELRARVDNNVSANAGLSYNNTTSYTFAALAAGASIIDGGNDTTVTPLTIVEPNVSAGVLAANISNPGVRPVAGDIIELTTTITAAGGGVADIFSDAFDLSYNETFSLALAFNAASPVVVTGVGNTIAAPVITGDGITVPQSLQWSLADGNADIDIAEGTVITLSYQLVVLDNFLNNQSLFNNATVRWTSVDNADINERDGSEIPAINDYIFGPFVAVSVGLTGVGDGNAIVKSRLTDTFGAGDSDVRIGDIIDYELRLTVQRGTSPNVVVTDTLPQGLIFEEIVSINGDTAADFDSPAIGIGSNFVYSTITAADVVAAGNPVLDLTTTVTWTIGDVVNQGAGDPTTDDLVIVYRARVLNLVHPQVATINLLNSAAFSYNTATVPAVQVEDETIAVLQPDLAVSKTAVPAGGVTIDDPANTIIEADEIITYTIDIVNSGTAPAYDVVLNDVIPVGLRDGVLTITTDSVELLVAGPLAPLPAVYDNVTGIAVWDFDNGVADTYTIPALDTLRIVYRVQAEPGLGAGLTMINAAVVPLYYSLDDENIPVVGAVTGVREIYGPTNTDTVTLTTTNPNPPLQTSPSLTATIGEPFTYRIRVPDVVQATALHDVRIIEDLSVSAADPVDISFVSATRITGTQPWGLIDVGTAPVVELEDLATGVGIEVPSLDFIEVDMEVVLRDQAVNVAGNVFNNTVSYTFNGVDDLPATETAGGADTSADIRILEPLDLVLTIGPAPGPISMAFGTPATFTIDVENSIATNVNASDAYDLTVTNVLPDLPNGGMCDTPPAGISAEIRDNVGALVRGLALGTDYVTSYVAAPVCTLTVTMQSFDARIEPDNHLFISYDATLDVDSVDNVNIINSATPSQWFSADTPAGVAVDEIRTYSNGLNGATANTDTITANVFGPTLEIDKEVVNLTSGGVAVPGVILQAEADDRLRYTITVRNTGRAAIDDFSVTDEPDRLTTPPGLFTPSSMSNIVLPVGLPIAPATDFTNITAGANGAGILDIRTLSLTEAGGGVDNLTIVFEMLVAPVVENGLLISNQAELISPNFSDIPSDDPNFPGAADPTQTLIGSAPAFVTEKRSADLTGSASLLAAGDTIRYTLLVKNVGAENSVDTILRDQIPAHTAYVANSTTLNGIAVADVSAGISRIESGLSVNAPENTTAGFMRADSTSTTANIATVTFDVVVATNVINGTAISNQSFVQGTGLSGVPYPDQPSDDPDTDIVNDPTIDVVGNLPILKIQKTADFVAGVTGDVNGDGVVDNGEQLLYTFQISNTGSTQATNVLLADLVPLNSSYNANSLVVNGDLTLVDAIPGISPLIAGINVSSTPLPTFAQVGVIEPGQTAEVSFEVTVTGIAGQLITNQATLDSNELPQKLSDADGNDENGDQATVVVIGNSQQLSITKEVSVVGGGVASPGSQLEYVITVRNIGSQAVTDIVITDTVAAELNLVSGSLTMNGVATGVTVLGADITANYGASYGDLDAGGFITLRFVATIGAAEVNGTSINNTARVDWNAGTQNVTDAATIDVGGAPGVASVNGLVWWDANFNDVLDSGEIILSDWFVDIYLRGTLLDSVTTDANGEFQANGLVPSALSGAEYELRYRAPDAGATSASLGVTSSIFTNALQRTSNIVVAAGTYNEAFDLPIEPNGIVYDSVLRVPVAGATLTMINQTKSNQAVPASCYDDPNHQTQVTLSQGFYKFDLNFSNARCDEGDEYEIQILPPASGYVGTTSVIIPPVAAVTGAAFDVPNCPTSLFDLVTATSQHCENSALATQQPTSVAARTAGTNYHLKFLFNNVPSTDQIYNNHIPVDPRLDAAISISKVSGLLNVTRSQLVPYTITLTNSIGAPLSDLSVVDNFPAGFKYIADSARVDGVADEPVIDVALRTMTWDNIAVNTSDSVVIKMLLVVGSGVGEGEYVNTAQVMESLTGGFASGVASATVRVIPDPTFDCTDIIGKVYEDQNLNAYQDKGEHGIPGVQVATARGLRVTTDTHGRFHITCAIVPNEVRGSNFIMKVDDRTLPSGYRITTENPRVQRATRGKMLKYNFGAAIHRVVRLDLADGVFEKGTTDLRPQWQSRIDFLIIELQKDPSILRLSYLGENESESEVDDRLDAIEDLISDRWEELDCCYRLTIETEVFWRKGNPSDRKEFD